jgi:hypothetical protein
MEEQEQDNKIKSLNFMANGLLGEVTFAQVIELVKAQAWKQSEEAYDEKMSDEEKETLLGKISDMEKEFAKKQEEGDAPAEE